VQARNRNICRATLDEKIVRTFQKHEAFQVFLDASGLSAGKT